MKSIALRKSHPGQWESPEWERPGSGPPAILSHSPETAEESMASLGKFQVCDRFIPGGFPVKRSEWHIPMTAMCQD